MPTVKASGSRAAVCAILPSNLAIGLRIAPKNGCAHPHIQKLTTVGPLLPESIIEASPCKIYPEKMAIAVQLSLPNAKMSALQCRKDGQPTRLEHAGQLEKGLIRGILREVREDRISVDDIERPRLERERRLNIALNERPVGHRIAADADALFVDIVADEVLRAAPAQHHPVQTPPPSPKIQHARRRPNRRANMVYGLDKPRTERRCLIKRFPSA